MNIPIALAVGEPLGETLMPFYGIAVLAFGLAGGITGLIAVARRHERSPLVWLAMAPGLMTVIFLLGEFLVPH